MRLMAAATSCNFATKLVLVPKSRHCVSRTAMNTPLERYQSDIHTVRFVVGTGCTHYV